jgi:hypothetical protein
MLHLIQPNTIFIFCQYGSRVPSCWFGWWLTAGADLFCEKSTVGWLLVADLF